MSDKLVRENAENSLTRLIDEGTIKSFRHLKTDGSTEVYEVHYPDGKVEEESFGALHG